MPADTIWLYCALQRQAKAKLLVDKVCEYVNVMERDYFSCTYNTAEGKVSVWHVAMYYSVA